MQPFFETLDVGETVTLATNGSLEFKVRCTGTDATPTLELFFTASVDGWFCRGTRLAGDECTYIGNNTSSGPSYTYRIDWGSAVTPDGNYIGVDGETTGLGFNIFGHDCLAVGGALHANTAP